MFITVTIFFHIRDINNELSTSTVVSTVEIPHTHTVQEFNATINKHISDILSESWQNSVATDPTKTWTPQSIVWTSIPDSVVQSISQSIAS